MSLKQSSYVIESVQYLDILPDFMIFLGTLQFLGCLLGLVSLVKQFRVELLHG